jgi:hypothetical protein
MIMQIARNTIPIFQHAKSLLISSRLTKFEGDGRLARKGLRHIQVGLCEGRMRNDPTGHDGTTRTGLTPQRKRHHLSDRHVWKVQLDIRMLINGPYPQAVAVLHGLPRNAVLRRITKSNKLAFSRTRGHDDF